MHARPWIIFLHCKTCGSATPFAQGATDGSSRQLLAKLVDTIAVVFRMSCLWRKRCFRTSTCSFGQHQNLGWRLPPISPPTPPNNQSFTTAQQQFMTESRKLTPNPLRWMHRALRRFLRRRALRKSDAWHIWHGGMWHSDMFARVLGTQARLCLFCTLPVPAHFGLWLSLSVAACIAIQLLHVTKHDIPVQSSSKSKPSEETPFYMRRSANGVIGVGRRLSRLSSGFYVEPKHKVRRLRSEVQSRAEVLCTKPDISTLLCSPPRLFAESLYTYE